MVRDPSLADLLAVVVVSALLSLTRAALRAHTALAVERERQATERLAICWSAAGPQPARLPATREPRAGSRDDAASPSGNGQ